MAIAAGHIKILIFLAGLLILGNVGLNLLPIPRWSFNGAGFSTFACELLSAAILGLFVMRMLVAPWENHELPECFASLSAELDLVIRNIDRARTPGLLSFALSGIAGIYVACGMAMLALFTAVAA